VNAPPAYRHTQRNRLRFMLILSGTAVLLSVLALVPQPVNGVGIWLTIAVAVAVMIGSAVTFSALTIAVRDGQLTWHFGGGVMKKSIPLADIARAEPTTTRLYEGWGVHFTTRGWLYNVAGRRAVLITLRNGKQCMLGTDEPEAVVAAIHRGPS
jgi:hypothetical protein